MRKTVATRELCPDFRFSTHRPPHMGFGGLGVRSSLPGQRPDGIHGDRGASRGTDGEASKEPIPRTSR